MNAMENNELLAVEAENEPIDGQTCSPLGDEQVSAPPSMSPPPNWHGAYVGKQVKILMRLHPTLNTA